MKLRTQDHLLLGTAQGCEPPGMAYICLTTAQGLAKLGFSKGFPNGRTEPQSTTQK
jgi:hypothetical protein